MADSSTHHVFRVALSCQHTEGLYGKGAVATSFAQPQHLQRHLYSYVSHSLGDIEEYAKTLEAENSQLKQKMLSTIRPALVCLFASQDGLVLSAVLGAWKRFWEESKIQAVHEYW